MSGAGQDVGAYGSPLAGTSVIAGSGIVTVPVAVTMQDRR
jgi:hypothetical protein